MHYITIEEYRANPQLQLNMAWDKIKELLTEKPTMTLTEKLALPPGAELDAVILADLLPGWTCVRHDGLFNVWRYERPDGTYQGTVSLISEDGWWAFWEWCGREDNKVEFLIWVHPSWRCIVNDDWEADAETPLLAAWRAALSWHHRKEQA